MLGLIRRISSSTSGKSSLIFGYSISPVLSRSSQLQPYLIFFSCTWPKERRGEPVEIQDSPQTLVIEPLPMIFPRCSTRRSLTAKIPRQPCDIDLDGSTRRRLAFWQYFPMRTLESKQLWLVNIHHGSFANKVVLNNCISLSPKPLILLVVLFSPKKPKTSSSFHHLSPTRSES